MAHLPSATARAPRHSTALIRSGRTQDGMAYWPWPFVHSSAVSERDESLTAPSTIKSRLPRLASSSIASASSLSSRSNPRRPPSPPLVEMASSPALVTVKPVSNGAGPRKTRMHRLIEEDGIVLMPGIYDALSAAVLQSLGYKAGFVSGYAVSATRLGMPDIGLLTPPEMADAARAICAAAPNVAFIVDADTGGGNALNVQRTVRDIIATGAAGLFLEDQVWPKKCGHMQGKQVIPAEEHAAKIAAAREAIGDSDFFLIARTDARATAGGLADAIARANLYMEAGADACFVEAPRSDDEMREVCKKTNGFRAANMLEGGYTPLHTPQELKELGFHLIVHSTTAVYAAARALIDVLKALKDEGSSRDHLHKLTTFEEFNGLIGLKTLNEIGARFEKFSVPKN